MSATLSARRDVSQTFTSPRVRGEVEGAERARVRGPLRNSEPIGNLLWSSDPPAALRQRQRPLIPTFSPRAGRRSAHVFPLQPYNAATALTSIRNCSCTRRSIISSVLGG